MPQVEADLLKSYFEENPSGAASKLLTVSDEHAASILESLSPELAASIATCFQPAVAAHIFSFMPLEKVAAILENLGVQLSAAIFLQLSGEQREKILQGLSQATRDGIYENLLYPEDSAGRIMSTDFLSFHTGLKVDEVIRRIRVLARRGLAASYAYVVDGAGVLTGVINMRDLMLANPDDLIEQVMRKNVFSVDAFMDREQVARELTGRNFFVVPVVDSQRKMIGVVRAQELIGDVQEEATEDIQKMFGAGGDERSFSPILFSLKKRLFWLHVNLATAFLAASVVGLFEGIIAKISALAVFMPVVAGQGGNAGAQSLAVVMRGLVMREIPSSKVAKLVLKETWIGFLNGIVIGIVTGLIAWIWEGNPWFGAVMSLAMIVNLIIAGFFGAAIPIVMKALGLDPAQCSNIVLTTFTDVIGFFSFLGFAVLFQKLLI